MRPRSRRDGFAGEPVRRERSCQFRTSRWRRKPIPQPRAWNKLCGKAGRNGCSRQCSRGRTR